ncbi:PqqD family protein, HPr-rel-A system [Aromatoleum petrolei]|nr:PqqD family protein, HPr-rel-A system [Aromatoleum petrolei]
MTLNILSGRSLVFSPQWNDEGASVLFDSTSGDYWVLTPLAREIVRHTTDAGPTEASTLVRHVGSRASAFEGGEIAEATIRRVIDELVELSILAHT